MSATLTATYDCVYLVDEDEMAQWGGWCDPENPWGTADDDYDPEFDGEYGIGEPIELVLPLDEAAEFVRDFPGAVWDLHDDCDASQNYRTGVYTRVTLHVDKDHAEQVFALVERSRMTPAQ